MIAVGEVALLLNVFGEETIGHPYDEPQDGRLDAGLLLRNHHPNTGSSTRSIPLHMARTWFLNEQLPENWKPIRKVTLRHFVRDAKLVKKSIAFARRYLPEMEARSTSLRFQDGSSEVPSEELEDDVSTDSGLRLLSAAVIDS